MATQTTAEIVAELEALGGVPVVYGADTSFGLLDQAEELVLENGGYGGVIAGAPVVTVATAAFATAFAQDNSITVDAVSFTIRDHRKIDDGVLTKVWLSDT